MSPRHMAQALKAIQRSSQYYTRFHKKLTELRGTRYYSLRSNTYSLQQHTKSPRAASMQLHCFTHFHIMKHYLNVFELQMHTYHNNVTDLHKLSHYYITLLHVCDTCIHKNKYCDMFR
jgi:hypothetical protein